jgi:hypothetical protein
LQTIGELFPHYSRHDESHSKQILVNIERLLGENIHLLTATDTWLILEAAYWHDIGMVVPKKDMEEAIADEKFSHYLIEIKNNPYHDLYKFAINFDPSDLMKCFVGADSPVDAIDKFRQLMAEWFRRQHTIRSDNTIRSPWEQIGLSSPRTELIPKRLFNTLGRICALHGANFSEITSDSVLPFREAGLGQEDCHPRFVACLLRLGDLLDLDNNRFCPVMQRIAGDDRPNLSKAHEDKHISIQHFRLDRDKIEVTAECETIPGYIETYKWFEWLKQEIQDQVSNWMAIVPNRELGLLPTLGNIFVNLKGEHQIITPGKRPEFTVDGSNVMNLLQGNNLYNTKFACVRELLQNAIDSTLIKIWLTDVPENNKTNWTNPLLDNIQEKLSQHHVLFSIEQNNSIVCLDDKISVWDITITDQGTGISLEDLIYMMKIGGSQNNLSRQRMIQLMPEWLKPSGNFGIGFQSVFLITDEILITTKNIKNGMTLEITMHSPTSKNQGLVLVKELPHSFSNPYGTKVKLTIKTPKFAKRWTMSFDREHTMIKDFLSILDPVLDDSFPFDVAQIADHVSEFSKHSLLPIKASLRTNEISRTIPCIHESNEDKKSWNFIIGKENSGDEYQIIIKWLPVFGEIDSTCFYRGQKIEAKNIGVNNCRIWIDILSGKASTWLTASRDKLKKDAEIRLYGIILDALLKVISIDLEKNTNNQEFLQYASVFLAGFSDHDEQWKSLYEKTNSAWLDIIIPNQSKTFKDLLNEKNLTIGYAQTNRPRSFNILRTKNHIDFESQYILDIFITEWLKKCNTSIEINGSSGVPVEVPRCSVCLMRTFPLRTVDQAESVGTGV